MTTISRSEMSIDTDEVNEIEQYVKLKLPHQYKDHILEHNGGKPYPNIFIFNKDGKLEGSDLDWFLAIYDGEYDNLKTYVNIYKVDSKRLPKHFFPIGHDSGGNMICISCGEKDYGYIYFWDHENEVDYSTSDDSDYSNLHLIAKSFNEFLDGLMTLEEFEKKFNERK